jgi:hypothetical protein
MIKPNFLIALAVLCVAIGLGYFLIQGDRPSWSHTGKVGEHVLDVFDKNEVKSVTLKKSDLTIKIDKSDKNWVMASHKNRPVLNERMDALFASVIAAQIVNTRTGKDDLFALDEKGRTELTIDRGSASSKLYVGKQAEGISSFLRKELTGEILEVDKNLDNDAGIRTEKEDRILDPRHFYDLKGLNIGNEDIIEVAIKKGNDVVRLQKVLPGKGPLEPKQEIGKDDPKPVWWLTEQEGAAVDDAAVTNIVSNISFTFKDYAGDLPAKDLGLDKPTAKVKVRLKDGSEKHLIFGNTDAAEPGKPNEKFAVVQVEGKPEPYKIEKYIFESIVKDAKDIKKKEPEKKEDEKKAEGTAPETNERAAAPAPAPAPNAPPKTEAAKQNTAPKEVIPPPPVMKVGEEAPLPPAIVKQPDNRARIEKKESEKK